MPLRRPTLPDASRELFSSNPFTFRQLRTLSQHEARLTPFSSIASALFAQNTGGGVDRAMVASIRYLSAKSFVCHRSEKSPAKSNHCHTSENSLPQPLCLPHIRTPLPGVCSPINYLGTLTIRRRMVILSERLSRAQSRGSESKDPSLLPHARAETLLSAAFTANGKRSAVNWRLSVSAFLTGYRSRATGHYPVVHCISHRGVTQWAPYDPSARKQSRFLWCLTIRKADSGFGKGYRRDPAGGRS